VKKILVYCFLFFTFYNASAQTWNALGVGVNNTVESLLAHDSVLYVGGIFDSAGGGLSRGIAQWNGKTWSSVGSGFGPTGGYGVSAMAWYRGELYVGGSFNKADGKLAHNIARWDGKNWAVVDSGTNGYINALTEYNGELYAAGGFTTAGEISTFGIAKWNDTVWSSVGSAKVTGGTPSSLAVYMGNLYMGGAMDSVDHIHVSGIAEWNGVKWDSLSNNKWNNDFGFLYADDSVLYGGGAGGSHSGLINFFGQWNGTYWDSVPDTRNNVNLPVNAIISNNGMVYAGGWFDSIGGVYSQSIAMWDGKKWNAMSYGIQPLSAGVQALAVFDSSVYAGGTFHYAEGNRVNNIAEWCISGCVTGISKFSEHTVAKAFPNPSNGTFTFNFSANNEKAYLTIYNMLGENIYNTQFNTSATQIDLSGRPAGVYLYRVVNEKGEALASGKLIVQ